MCNRFFLFLFVIRNLLYIFYFFFFFCGLAPFYNPLTTVVVVSPYKKYSYNYNDNDYPAIPTIVIITAAWIPIIVTAVAIVTTVVVIE